MYIFFIPPTLSAQSNVYPDVNKQGMFFMF